MKEKEGSRIGQYALYGMALVCLSQASVIIRWSETDPLILGAWRLLWAALFLGLWSRWSQGPTAPIQSEDWRRIVISGFAFFAHLFSYAWAAHHTSIAHLMLIFSLNPVTTALGAWFFYQEKLTVRQMASYALALLGIYLLAREHHGTSAIAGDAMALVAAITFSIYALLSRSARQNLSNRVFAARMYGVGSAFFFGASLLVGVSPVTVTAQGWVAIVLLTLFPTLLGHGIFTHSMRVIPLPILSLGKLAEPPLAAITAFFIFGETLRSYTLLSFGLIIMAVLLLIRFPRQVGPEAGGSC